MVELEEVGRPEEECLLLYGELEVWELERWEWELEEREGPTREAKRVERLEGASEVRFAFEVVEKGCWLLERFGEEELEEMKGKG